MQHVWCLILLLFHFQTRAHQVLPPPPLPGRRADNLWEVTLLRPIIGAVQTPPMSSPLLEVGCKERGEGGVGLTYSATLNQASFCHHQVRTMPFFPLCNMFLTSTLDMWLFNTIFAHRLSYTCHLWKKSSISDERARKIIKSQFSKNLTFGPTLHPV